MPDIAAKVLLVEDDLLVVNAIRNMLTRFGFELIAARDEDASALFQQHARELLLLIVDIAVPQKTAIEFVQRLPTLTPRIPVLFITSLGKEELQKRADVMGD